LSVERKNEVKIEYGCPERANLLWKVIEQIYGSINSKKSSSSAPENISSSSTLFYQSQEEQSSSQKEKEKFVSLVKSDCPISQTGLFSFGKMETSLAEEDDCSTSSSNYDDDTDDEYGEQKLLVEFKKLISKHMKLQKRHRNLLCSHKEFMDSYALLESTHEVMVTTVNNYQSHTCTSAQPSIDLSCANSYCSQAKPSCDEHVLVKTCDSLIASKIDTLKRENEILKIELSLLKDKGHLQPYQDNRAHMVKKFDKPKIKKKAQVKCFEC
jgi:hypothetical protein